MCVEQASELHKGLECNFVFQSSLSKVTEFSIFTLTKAANSLAKESHRQNNWFLTCSWAENLHWLDHVQ